MAAPLTSTEATTGALPSLTVRQCDDGDVGELMRFMHRHWRSGHVLSRDEALLRWQFDPRRDHMRRAGPTVTLALTDGRIGGMLGLIPFDLNIHGLRRRGAWIAQWFCRRELRRQQAALALLWRAQREYDALFGLGLSSVGRAVAGGLGFELVARVPRWIAVVDAAATIELLAPFTPAPQRVREWVQPYLVPAVPNTPALHITPWSESFSDMWDRCWTRCLAPAFVGPARDSAYLAWRYLNHPRFHYDLQVAAHPVTGELLGIAVSRVERLPQRDQRVLRVVELLALPSAGGTLAAALVRSARELGVMFTDCYGTSAAVRVALEAAGFRQHPSGDPNAPPFPDRLQPPEPGAPLAAAFWLRNELRRRVGPLGGRPDFHITKSDSDQDRPN